MLRTFKNFVVLLVEKRNHLPKTFASTVEPSSTIRVLPYNRSSSFLFSNLSSKISSQITYNFQSLPWWVPIMGDKKRVKWFATCILILLYNGLKSLIKMKSSKNRKWCKINIFRHERSTSTLLWRKMSQKRTKDVLVAWNLRSKRKSRIVSFVATINPIV